MLPKFFTVEINLDNKILEKREGFVRIGSVQYIDDNGNEIEEKDYEEYEITVRTNDLMNLEYHTGQELQKEVAEQLGINLGQVEIVGKPPYPNLV